MACSADLSGATFCVVTGASQGIGRTLAVEFSKKMGAGSLMLLLARNNAGLSETKALAESANVKVRALFVDLSTASSTLLNDIIKDTLTGYDVAKFDLNLIVHNAGSIGDLTVATSSLTNVDEWQKYYALNVFNTAILNSVFLGFIKDNVDKTVVMNITSLCAIKPMPGLAYYCSGKAAREMYFRVLAEEMPSLRVLNYSPGPVQTSMIEDVISSTVNERLRDVFISFKTDDILLTTEQTAEKCLKVLEEGNYKSGDHVDFFD